MANAKLRTAEDFLREKLETQISDFGDGMDEFHTREIEHLLKCLDDNDVTILTLLDKQEELSGKINFNAEKQFAELLEVCMTINNLSAEQRLGYIRSHYKDIWNKIKKA